MFGFMDAWTLDQSLTGRHLFLYDVTFQAEGVKKGRRFPRLKTLALIADRHDWDRPLRCDIILFKTNTETSRRHRVFV